MTKDDLKAGHVYEAKSPRKCGMLFDPQEQFIGCEQDAKWFEIAQQRLDLMGVL